MSAKSKPAPKAQTQTDWKQVVKFVQCSRAMDEIEERELVPGKKIFYQFSARGHDMAQVLLLRLLSLAPDPALARRCA